MKTSIGLLLAASLIAPVAHAAKPDCTNIKGTWENELGSTLVIDNVAAGGIILGNYTSPSGTTGQARSLTGWVNAGAPVAGKSNVKVVSFSVNWGATYGSVTSWSGACSMQTGKPVITTLWHLTRATTGYSWDHTLSGTDTFTPK